MIDYIYSATYDDCDESGIKLLVDVGFDVSVSKTFTLYRDDQNLYTRHCKDVHDLLLSAAEIYVKSYRRPDGNFFGDITFFYMDRWYNLTQFLYTLYKDK